MAGEMNMLRDDREQLLQSLHVHVLTLERILAGDPGLPLADIIRDLRAAAEFILTAAPPTPGDFP
jgi:hypothetical protein